MSEKIEHIRDNTEQHHHDFIELTKCCTVDGCFDLSLIDAHGDFVDLRSNGDIRCDSVRGPCACGTWH